MIEIICSYCKKHMGYKKCEVNAGKVSHSACDECYKKVMEELED